MGLPFSPRREMGSARLLERSLALIWARPATLEFSSSGVVATITRPRALTPHFCLLDLGGGNHAV